MKKSRESAGRRRILFCLFLLAPPQKAFFAHFTMGKSPRWIFSEIIDSLLSIAPPGFDDETDRFLLRGAPPTPSLPGDGGKVHSADSSAFSSPCLAVASCLSSRSSNLMESAVSSPYPREGEEQSEPSASPTKQRTPLDVEDLREVSTRAGSSLWM